MLDRWWTAILLGSAGLLSVGLLWELALQAEFLPEEDIPHPADVLTELWNLCAESETWDAVLSTLRGAGVGLLIAIAIALAAGILMGVNEYLRRAFRPTVEFLRSVPGITLIPLAILLWGPTTQSTTFLVAFGCVWPMLIQTMAGVASVDDTALLTARSFGLGPLQRVRWVVIPSALPFVVTGLRICTGIGLVVAVATELIIGTPGIGSIIGRAQDVLNLERMYAAVLLAGLIGVALSLIVGRLERYFLRWHPSTATRSR